MRILLLPLTRRHTLLFAQRLTENELNKPSPWLAWMMTQSQKTWADWGKSQTKWKLKTVQVGNRLLDRIDWEEYSLKSVHDPRTTTAGKIPLVHPSWVSSDDARKTIEDIIRRRKPLHQRYRWRWGAVIPLLIPFSLVPVLPNLPLFYAIYRCWSHHRALKGAQYLENLHSHNVISEPNRMLDRIYALKKTPKLTVEDVVLDSPTSELLISEAKLGEIAGKFGDTEISVLGKRAIAQITNKLLEGEGKSKATTTSKIEKDKGEKNKTNISTVSMRKNSRRENKPKQ